MLTQIPCDFKVATVKKKKKNDFACVFVLNDFFIIFRPQRDPFFDTEAEEKDTKVEEDAKKIKQRQTYVKRVIVHPSFHNISYSEAEKMMKTTKQGDAIVRPSSKGADHLTVTWKVTEDIYQHIDVKEEGKGNAFSLGTSLWIATEEFEDLDEILARHVNPMASYASELLDYKHFKPTVMGMKDKAEELLKELQRENPGSIPYIISAAKVSLDIISNFSHSFCLYRYSMDKFFNELLLLTELSRQILALLSSSLELSSRVRDRFARRISIPEPNVRSRQRSLHLVQKTLPGSYTRPNYAKHSSRCSYFQNAVSQHTRNWW